MVKSKLSDDEWSNILAFCTAERWADLKTYLDQLLYLKGLGTDCCARPLAFRLDLADGKKQDAMMETPCFAVGYLDKIGSYLSETNARETVPEVTIEKTLKYISKLKEEINRFFNKG